MTNLEKPVTRRVGDLVVKIAAEGVYVREARRRHWYGPVGWGYILLQAAKATADEVVASRPRRHRASRGLLRGR